MELLYLFDLLDMQPEKLLIETYRIYHGHAVGKIEGVKEIRFQGIKLLIL